MRKKSLKSRFFILFTLTLVSILGIFYLINTTDQSSMVRCWSTWAFPKTKEVKYYTSPEKIVFQPWLGQHNVYAVFMIPKEYRYDYLFRLDLPGEDTRCGFIQRANQSVVADVDAKTGYYLLKGYLNTRIALRLIFQGHLNQLQQPQNWKLGYFKRYK